MTWTRCMAAEGFADAPCKGLRMLVVEDHAFQRRMLVQLLQRLGSLEVHQAEDGEAALALLRAIDLPFDVVVTDLWMPGMDGLAFVRELGAAGMQAGVILSSALEPDAREAVAREARACGVRLLGAIDKPITEEKLAPLLAVLAASPRRA